MLLLGLQAPSKTSNIDYNSDNMCCVYGTPNVPALLKHIHIDQDPYVSSCSTAQSSSVSSGLQLQLALRQSEWLTNACRDYQAAKRSRAMLQLGLLALELVPGTTAMTVPSGRLTHPPTPPHSPLRTPPLQTLLHLPTLAATAGQPIGTARAQRDRCSFS
jgi:hypothetical protein